MQKTTIEFSYDASKLEALNMYLEEKNGQLNDELERFMDSLYKNYVPKDVQNFVEKKEEATQSKRNIRKKRNGKNNGISGENDAGGTTTRQNEEKQT